MPIITFQGLPLESVERYYQQVEEISSLIGTHRDNVFFVVDSSSKLLNPLPSAYIQVQWKSRPDKEELLVHHLHQYFAKYGVKIAIFFTEVNGKLFINENRIG